MKPYLIQRGTFKDTQAINGIDSLVRWEYMGSSEFEFGGLKRSLERIVETLEDYAAWTTEHLAKDGRALVLFCRPASRREIVRALLGLINRTARTKGPTWIYDALSCRGHSADTNFWWDIEHDYMLWLGEKNTPRVKVALEKVRERWNKSSL